MKFGPETIVHLECKKCGIKETIMLRDLMVPLVSTFITIPTAQCMGCLGVANVEIREDGK